VKRTRAARAELLARAPAVWKSAPRITWGPASCRTAFRALWNDEGLFVAFDARDPEPWHTFTRHDDRLWDEEVVEIFIDPDRSGTHYLELEISPANVTMDAHILSPLPMKSGDPPWKGDFTWDLIGLETRAFTRERRAKVEGWTAVGFLPWDGLRTLPSTAHTPLPPRAGDRWRFNVFRIERPPLPGGGRGEILAAWSAAPIPKFHVPSVFRDLVFR
jgi:hypothetical protein